MVLIGLRMVAPVTEAEDPQYQEMFSRALDWLLSFQCPGWGLGGV